MTTFDKREDSFEKKFAHDEELRFRATARRNKKLAAWAAEKLGRTDADAYFKEVMAADFEEAGDDDVIRKIVADFAKVNPLTMVKRTAIPCLVGYVTMLITVSVMF